VRLGGDLVGEDVSPGELDDTEHRPTNTHHSDERLSGPVACQLTKKLPTSVLQHVVLPL
jgi:hypothetical protein